MLARSLRFVAALATFAALAACNHTTESTDDDDDVSSVSNALTDDDQGGNLPAAKAAASPPASCSLTISTDSELMIRDVGVVEDPVRTHWTGSLANSKDGAWHFGRLMTNMAGDHDAVHFVERWLQRWERDRPVNGFNVDARPEMKRLVSDAWPKKADGHIDLTKAPLRLLAVVNRMDLRKIDNGNAGEGRFVFGVLDANGNPLQFTVILEFHLPAKTQADVAEWARIWHNLGTAKRGTETYNALLQVVTDKFSGKNAAPGRTNGSAISQVRTNEIALANEWELREFRLSSSTGQLFSATVKQTPDLALEKTQELTKWINDNESKILDGTQWVTETTGGKAFRAGSALTPVFFSWAPNGVKNPEARHLFSLNTCNGCHAGETSTFFLHVSPRAAGQPAALSGFLTGETVADPVTGTKRKFSDLARRSDDFKALVCAK